MMKNRLFIGLILFFAVNLVAQEGKTVLGRSELLIGQQTSLTYMIKLENQEKVNFKPFITAIPVNRINGRAKNKAQEKVELEIIESFHDTILKGNTKEVVWVGGYKVTAWDSGKFEIPKIEIKFPKKTLILPSAIISVDLVAAKKGQDIYDIKESFARLPKVPFIEKVKKVFFSYWWVLALLALSIIGFILFKYRKPKRAIPEKVVELSLLEGTLKAIDELEKKKLWLGNDLKEHYTELSFIMRSFLSHYYQLNLLEKTSDEAKMLLAQKGVGRSVIDRINEILIQSDLVKFAKSKPDEISILLNLSVTKKIVEDINQNRVGDVE